MNPSLYGQLIFEKQGTTIKWSKNSLFNKRLFLQTWTATCKKVKLTPYTKRNSRWIKDLNIIHDTIKVLQENIGKKISDIPFSNIFTDMSPKARDIKERINKLHLIKIKSFCTAKGNSIKMKREPTIYESIFANNTQTRVWSPEYIKDSHDFTVGRQTTQLKWANDLNRHFSKEDIQKAQRHENMLSIALCQTHAN